MILTNNKTLMIIINFISINHPAWNLKNQSKEESPIIFPSTIISLQILFKQFRWISHSQLQKPAFSLRFLLDFSSILNLIILSTH